MAWVVSPYDVLEHVRREQAASMLAYLADKTCIARHIATGSRLTFLELGLL